MSTALLVKSQRTIQLVLLGALLTASAASESSNEDPQYTKLKMAVDAANTQLDMIKASLELSQYVDGKLTTLESVILKDLDSQALILFNRAAASWREYRKAQSEFEADIYRNGSLQRFTKNLTYTRITTERVNALVSLSQEGVYARFGLQGAGPSR